MCSSDLLSKRRDFDENKGERLSLRNFTNKERILFLTEINKVKPALIICFGWVALDYFKEKYFGKIKRISIDNDRTAINIISKEHGHLFKIKEGPYLIPLMHYSKKGRRILPTDEYLKRFRKGLKQYDKEIKNGK